ncbi:unnamed protein product (macronuclear) [Paramecium tetraurelia]|uniref:Uncharacterized protein n=1 Tax=Paramecium tetraurelia TaxID=5888 RepID=A0C9M5_PARTE|nr:uncharacterized protein GSPATT00006798001 [Paramecium tetraurelia]CAK67492.1 unnamed protein product [Paramecium tetraurelia]|eukprot:XP_001434889.1 hypothetical protein (macronuclear) [Paramecium tetraurelia strain d4-2]
MQNIDIYSTRNRKSEVSDVSALQASTHKTMLLELSLPKINIIVHSFEPKLKNLIKADGDQTDINPETERISKRQNHRLDMFKNEIVKGQKTHRITFRDQIDGQSLQQIKYFHKEPQEDLDECCPCNIF